MKTRSPIVVLLLSLLTFGIYALVWHIQTKEEMNKLYNAQIPTAWLLLLPFIGPLLWSWKWSAGAEKATGMSAVSVFLLMMLIPVVGIPVMVSKFNNANAPAGGVAMLRAA
jgi:cytochrome bd-type quinol oxidase subunit 2